MSELNPRFVDAQAMRFVGLRRHYTGSDMDQAPGHWMDFVKQSGMANAVGTVAYGLVFDRPQGIDYMPAWEASALATTPSGFTTTQMPAGRYAVFPHQGHASKVHETVDRIWRHWVPAARHKPVERTDTAYFFERYGAKFDPAKGEGDIEIWIPVA